MFVKTEFDSIKDDNKNLCEKLDDLAVYLRMCGEFSKAVTVEEAIKELKK